MSATATPTPEQEQRAKWDLLLLDIEHRTEQLRQMNGVDRDLKLEQLRQLKTYEPKRLLIQGLTAAAVLMGAGAAIGALLVRLAVGP